MAPPALSSVLASFATDPPTQFSAPSLPSPTPGDPPPPPPPPDTITSTAATQTIATTSATVAVTHSTKETATSISTATSDEPSSTATSSNRPETSLVATSSSQSSGFLTSSILPPASTTATNAPVTSSTPAPIAQSETCSGLSCSPALKAAVAVPVVVLGVLCLLALCIFARRRRKTDEKSSGPKPKWTRHLKVFSFDAELLVGGRFSGSNIVGSGVPSLRSVEPSVRSQPSMLSIEQAAPPYRDALSHARPPTATMAQVLGYTTATGINHPGDMARPESSATAPPPYRAAAGSTTDEARSPTTPTSIRNPFRDNEAGSPFADPLDDDERSQGQVLSRSSSHYQPSSSRGGAPSFTSTLPEETDDTPTSIQHAQLARNMSGRGRTIDNIGRSTGS